MMLPYLLSRCVLKIQLGMRVYGVVQVREKASSTPRPGVPLTLALVYEAGTEVHSQDILQVQSDTQLITSENGRANLKVRGRYTSYSGLVSLGLVMRLVDWLVDHRVGCGGLILRLVDGWVLHIRIDRFLMYFTVID